MNTGNQGFHSRSTLDKAGPQVCRGRYAIGIEDFLDGHLRALALDIVQICVRAAGADSTMMGQMVDDASRHHSQHASVFVVGIEHLVSDCVDTLFPPYPCSTSVRVAHPLVCQSFLSLWVTQMDAKVRHRVGVSKIHPPLCEPPMKAHHIYAYFTPCIISLQFASPRHTASPTQSQYELVKESSNKGASCLMTSAWQAATFGKRPDSVDLIIQRHDMIGEERHLNTFERCSGLMLGSSPRLGLQTAAHPSWWMVHGWV